MEKDIGSKGIVTVKLYDRNWVLLAEEISYDDSMWDGFLTCKALLDVTCSGIVVWCNVSIGEIFNKSTPVIQADGSGKTVEGHVCISTTLVTAGFNKVAMDFEIDLTETELVGLINIKLMGNLSRYQK